jgi:crotonobetainyl-CoA:carnitine CoA-transferase CaiB-like acyl-CoA transferase
VAISTSSQSIAERVMRLVGRADLLAEPWFASGRTRAEHSDVLDDAVGGWIAAHSRAEVVDEFERAEAAVAPVYTAQDIAEDPHFEALGTIRRVPDDDLGELAMQGALFRMTDGDAPTRFPGRAPGVDTVAVLRELGYDDAGIAELIAGGAAGAPQGSP